MMDLTINGQCEEIILGLRLTNLWVGVVQGDMRVVTADKKVVTPAKSQKVWNHSPDGYNWGYGGSGPAQLALAILLYAGLPEDVAVRLHQQFKRAFVAKWPGDQNWYLRGNDLRDWIDQELGQLRQEQLARKEAGTWIE